MDKNISNETILNLENLAKIRLTVSERKEIKPQLDMLLEYFDTLNEIDTSDVEPLTKLYDDSNDNMLRDDVKIDYEINIKPDDILKCTPLTEDRYVKVPRTI